MLKAISTITNALGALNYKGTWNASSNTPTLADGTGAKGDYYVTSTAGTQTFGGLQLFFGIGDWIVYNGAVWQRVEGGSDGNFANVTMTSTDAGAAAAPLLDLYRDSATPAASDTLGEIEFNGEDSAGNKQQYAVIHGSILSPTSTAESGQLHFETATAGASTEKMIIGTSNLVINDIGGIFNVRIEGDTDANLFFTDATNSRVGIGTITPASKLDVNGTLGVSTGAAVGGATPGAGGLAFPATAVAVTDVNTLDDYKEGTFSPTVFGGTSAGTTTYAAQRSGYYTKIGRMIFFQMYVKWTAQDGTGDMLFGGFPAGDSLTYSYGSLAIGFIDSIALTAGKVPIAYIATGATPTAYLYQTPTGGGAAAAVPIDSAGEIMLSGFYMGP